MEQKYSPFALCDTLIGSKILFTLWLQGENGIQRLAPNKDREISLH